MAFTLAAGVITQTGTDANPSGLGAIAGVTTINDASGQVLTYDIKSLRLVINGNLTIPDRYWLKSEGTTPLNVITVGATGKLVIDGRQTITRPEGNVVIYSLACGISIRRPSGVPFTVRTIQFDSGSQFEQYGGILECSGAVRWISSTTSLATWKQATWYIFDRNNNQYMNVYFDLSKPSVDGFKLFSNNTVNPGFLKTLDPGFSIKGYECIGGLVSIGAIDGTTALVTLEGFVGGFSRFDFGVRQGGIVTNEGPVGGYDFINANIGNSLVPATNATANQTTGRARHFVRFTPTFLDATTSAGIEGGILYQKDANSGSRLVNNGVPNDKIYINTSGVGGEFNPILLLTKVWSGVGVNPMTQDNRLPINGYFWDYNQLGTPVNVTSSIGPQLPTLYAPEDTNVTLSRTAAAALIGTKFTFNTTTKKITVIANATYDELYDANKAFKCTATQLNLETPILSELIITANGSNLEAYTGWALEVATGVTLAQSTKFNKVKFDTVTIVGTGAITGVYQNSVGTSTIWEFGNDLDPIEVGTSLAIYDNAGVTKYFQQVTTEGVYRYYIAPQAVGETFTYAIEKYGTRRESGTFPSNAGGILFYVPSYGEDVGITETDLATVQAYTILSNTAQIYDATANFRLSEAGVKLGQLVARDGTFLDFGNLNVKIKDDASAIVSVASGTITYKSIVINSSDKYNAMKATPPKTITVTDNELINVLIEDANGDSQVSILGGDNLGYELWKVTTATATDDYATGTLLTTLATNALPYRFIGITGFDIVGRDVSSGVRRRSSMLKGSYTQAFYVGDQIQLATNAPQLIENNEKLDELILKIDTNLDEKISTRLAEIDYVATSQELITKVDAIEETVNDIDVDFTPVIEAIDELPTLAQIEASTVLASAENVTDAVTDIHNDLVKLNEGIKKASKIELYTDDL